MNANFAYLLLFYIIVIYMDKESKDKIVWLRNLLKANAPSVYQLFASKKRARVKLDKVKKEE